MAKIPESIIAKWGHPILDEGYANVPNIFLRYYHLIGLSDKAALFIIKVVNAPQGMWLSDDQLTMSSSNRTLKRIREELKDLTDDQGNKLVGVKTSRVQDEVTGEFKGTYLKYDFSLLIDFILKKYNELNTPADPKGQNDPSVDDPKGQNDTPDPGPGGQNDLSDTPKGQYDMSDIPPKGQNGTSENQNGLPEGQNGTPTDKMAPDINILDSDNLLDNVKGAKKGYKIIHELSVCDIVYKFRDDRIIWDSYNRREWGALEIVRYLHKDHPVREKAIDLYGLKQLI